MSKRREKCSLEELVDSLSSMLIPCEILEDFELYSSNQKGGHWELELREKPDRIPKELLGYSDVVLDGYCNPIEIQTSAFVLEPVYLKCYRRRWKRSGESIHYINTYELSHPKTKLVKKLGHFFKTKD